MKIDGDPTWGRDPQVGNRWPKTSHVEIGTRSAIASSETFNGFIQVYVYAVAAYSERIHGEASYVAVACNVHGTRTRIHQVVFHLMATHSLRRFSLHMNANHIKCTGLRLI